MAVQILVGKCDLSLGTDAITGAADLDDFVAKLELPRAAWVMVPAAYAGATVADLAGRMQASDVTARALTRGRPGPSGHVGLISGAVT